MVNYIISQPCPGNSGNIERRGNYNVLKTQSFINDATCTETYFEDQL